MLDFTPVMQATVPGRILVLLSWVSKVAYEKFFFLFSPSPSILLNEQLKGIHGSSGL